MVQAIETTETAESRINRVAGKLGLSLVSEFIPWSQSRKAGEKNPSLNWRVTLKKGVPGAGDSKTDPAILTTDYMAGSGHVPSYKFHDNSMARHETVIWECENGRPGHWFQGHVMPRAGGTLKPKFADVIHSLVMDSDVLDHPTFESWASDFGYDTDSRKAEAIYRACLEIALKLRNGLGEAGLAQLRAACQDY